VCSRRLKGFVNANDHLVEIRIHVKVVGDKTTRAISDIELTGWQKIHSSSSGSRGANRVARNAEKTEIRAH